MEMEEKVQILQKLDTKKLIARINQLEDELEQALRDEASFRQMNAGWLSSGTSDCAEVKAMEAELMALAPGSNQLARTAWLAKQRHEDPVFRDKIGKQADVAFKLDDCQIRVEMCKKRLESAKAVLNLKTAQISFLTE